MEIKAQCQTSWLNFGEAHTCSEKEKEKPLEHVEVYRAELLKDLKNRHRSWIYKCEGKIRGSENQRFGAFLAG